MDKLSYTLEGYLDAIYELSKEREGGVRLTDIATLMNVNKSTASAAVSSLAEKNLITSVHYGHILLTDLGVEKARLITQKHEIVYRFFTEVLELDPAIANTDACAIEHVISKEAVLKMQSLLSKKLF